MFRPYVEVVFFDELEDDLGLGHVRDIETEDLVAVEGFFDGVDEHDGEKKEY